MVTMSNDINKVIISTVTNSTTETNAYHKWSQNHLIPKNSWSSKCQRQMTKETHSTNGRDSIHCQKCHGHVSHNDHIRKKPTPQTVTTAFIVKNVMVTSVTMITSERNPHHKRSQQHSLSKMSWSRQSQ
jgi:hypothetical protein